MTIFANFFYYLRAKWNILSIYFNIKHFLFHFLLGFGNIDLSLDPSTCAFFTFFLFSFLVLWSINFLSLSIVLQLPFSFTCPSPSFFLLPVLHLPFSFSLSFNFLFPSPCPSTSFLYPLSFNFIFPSPCPSTSFLSPLSFNFLSPSPCPSTSFLYLLIFSFSYSLTYFFFPRPSPSYLYINLACLFVCVQ